MSPASALGIGGLGAILAAINVLTILGWRSASATDRDGYEIFWFIECLLIFVFIVAVFISMIIQGEFPWDASFWHDSRCVEHPDDAVCRYES